MDREAITATFNNLVDTGLPREIIYKVPGDEVGVYLTAAQAEAWKKLRFSEWGVEHQYEESVVVKLTDFPHGINKDAVVVMKDTDGEWYHYMIEDISPDAAHAGAVLSLGHKWQVS